MSKHDLLLLMQHVFDKQQVTVRPVEDPRINRTLAVTRKDMAYAVPDYETMLMELRDWMDAR